MSLFERDPDSLQSSTTPSVDNTPQDYDEDDTLLFPTLPAFLFPVEIRETPSIGPDHKGVFALVDIPSDTKFWKWTNRVHQIHKDELHHYIQQNIMIDKEDFEQQSSDDELINSTIEVSSSNKEAIQVFLRQGFVLPNDPDVFCSNPTDAGRFMNHSPTPNCGPDGTLRRIKAGEELTMDYSFHGNPQWYRDICARYGVLTERQVAELVARD
ncbi:hypothetical protein ACHAW5_002964 [Stephanodiscus triporus]|uniref:SET domain-containing protein n=1 Tax=Stephanodiscus triporus TaxID=2934178 RepID=A0ABD3PFB6_9STRA